MLRSLVLLLFSLSVHMTTAQTLQLAGLRYLYKASVVNNSHAPLLILLHGFGSNEQDLFGLAPHLPAEYSILSVQAPVALGKSAYAWYKLDMSTGKTVYDKKEAEQARLQLLRFIDSAKVKYAASQVHLLGFSQGAIMSYSVALTQPQKVNSITALSGRILEEIAAQVKPSPKLMQLKVFIGHGKNDQVLPLHYGQEAKAICTRAQVKLTYQEYNMAHEINQQELADIVKWLRAQLRK